MRRWLPIDLNPVRPAGISSTDEEHTAALDRARQVRDYLAECGWAGAHPRRQRQQRHLLSRVDLPNDADSLALIKRVLEALRVFFDDEHVKVDKTTYNAARIWKLYGTPARKGDSLPERPHRLARILEAPATVEVVSREQLEEIAALLPQAEEKNREGSQWRCVRPWAMDCGHGIATRAELRQGGRRFILARIFAQEIGRDRANALVPIEYRLPSTSSSPPYKLRSQVRSGLPLSAARRRCGQASRRKSSRAPPPPARNSRSRRRRTSTSAYRPG